MNSTINITLIWIAPKWWSRYERGKFVGSHTVFKQIWRKPTTGEIRIYSHQRGWPLDGVSVSVNGAPSVKVHRRGRFGRLHISETRVIK